MGPEVLPGQRCGDCLEGRGKDRGRAGPVVEGAAVRHSRRRSQGVGPQEPELIYVSEDDTARPTPAGRRALLHDPGEGGGPGVGMEEQLPPRAEWPPSEFGGELGGVAELAEEMGFGSPVRGRRAGRAQETEGTALPPAAPGNSPVDGRELSYSPQRADEGEKEKGREAKKKKKKKKKKEEAKDKVRVLEMLKQSRWSWRGSSLDPEFKRPKIKLRRGKGDSDSSSSSSHSGGPESKVLDSDEELLFPEESQAKHVARRCPGLLAKMGLQRCRKTLCARCVRFEFWAQRSREGSEVLFAFSRQAYH